MQPAEHDETGTSLELTFPEPDPDATPTGTSLVLPPSDPPPQPVAPPTSEPQVADADADEPGPLGDLVKSHFRRVEVAMLGRVLVSTLAGALPPAMVRVERRRKVFGEGEPIGVTVTAGETCLRFRAVAVGSVEATVGHVVRGVTLSTTTVTVAQWLDELGRVLDDITRDDEAARLALEKALVR